MTTDDGGSDLVLGILVDEIFYSCCGNGDTKCTGYYTHHPTSLPTSSPSELPTPAPSVPPVNIADICLVPEDYDNAADPGQIPSEILTNLWLSPPTCVDDGTEFGGGEACTDVQGVRNNFPAQKARQPGNIRPTVGPIT